MAQVKHKYSKAKRQANRSYSKTRANLEIAFP
uniref:Uncharacterized protein n=1 Tax=Anguilla anguilla TaxID=7936 RepID=A0A0E9SAQ1_ANGAN